MNINKTQQLVSRKDDRRFGKSIVCKILAGPKLINFMRRRSLIPDSIILDLETGYDNRSGRLFVLPATKWDLLTEFQKFITPEGYIANQEQAPNLSIRLPFSSASFTVNKSGVSRNQEKSATDKEAEERSGEQLELFLKQNIIMVSITPDKMPAGQTLGPQPGVYDVLIDSIDVSQTMEGTLVFAPVQDVRSWAEWMRGYRDK